MEFNFNLNQVLQQIDNEGFVIYDFKRPSLQVKRFQNQFAKKNSFNQEQQQSNLEQKQFAEIMNCLGQLSAKAQSLKQPITLYEKLILTDHRLFMKVEGNKVLGILKVGEKNLFYLDSKSQILELKPVCVLDFYVHEQYQRRGVGKALFERMLRYEQVQPEKLAYDRPSPKLLQFLKKHYGLINYISQNNNFVIYSQYFYSCCENNKIYKKTDNNKKELENRENLTSTNFNKNEQNLRSLYKDQNTSSQKTNILQNQKQQSLQSGNQQLQGMKTGENGDQDNMKDLIGQLHQIQIDNEQNQLLHQQKSKNNSKNFNLGFTSQMSNSYQTSNNQYGNCYKPKSKQ